jgi:hypothetical protein
MPCPSACLIFKVYEQISVKFSIGRHNLGECNLLYMKLSFQTYLPRKNYGM